MSASRAGLYAALHGFIGTAAGAFGAQGFGAVTPLGGGCMLLAWVLVARAALARV